MKKILFIIFIFSHSAFAECEIETYAKILKINKQLDQSIIKNSSCNSDINEKFVNFINSATGTLSANYLRHYFKNEKSLNLKLSPEKIQVNHIKDYLEDSFNNDALLIKKVSSLHHAGSFNLNENDNISFSCSNCNSTGEKNVSAYLNKSKVWLNVLIHVKRKAYKLVKNISNLSQKLDSSYFEEILITDKGNSPLLESIEHIAFYRPTKMLRKGDIIKKYDLRSRVVVKHGKK
jgi:hypothetical protein